MKHKTMLRIVVLLCITTIGITYMVPHFYAGKNERAATSQAGGSRKKNPCGEVIIWQMLYQHLFTFN